ncbi:MAG TPA: helix-turn-helix domain-containing protein [Ktedonobacterales bacterium]
MATGVMTEGKLLATPEETAAMLSLHRARVFSLMSAGVLKSCKIGRSRRVPLTEIQRFIDERMAEAAQARA